MDKNEDVTLAPRNRAHLLDDERKLGKIELTREEKLVLAQGIDTPLWDVIMRIWRKQRAVQIATTSLNVAQNENDLWFYRGVLAENGYIEGELKKIVSDFNKEEEKPKGQGKGEQPPPTGAREMISQVK